MARKFSAGATLASATAAATQGRAELKEVESRAGIAVAEVAIDDLMPNPANPPRRSTDNLEDLAASISEVGLLQPLVVRPRREGDPAGGEWMILGGHRRWAAAKLAGLERVPVHVAGGDVDVQVMLIENLQRESITPMEEARSYRLLTDQGFTQTQIAKMVSVSQGQVSKRLSLLKLDEVVQDALDQGKVGVDAVYAVLNDTEPALAREAVARATRGERSEPATATDLAREVRNVDYERHAEKQRQGRIDEATSLGAKVVERDQLPEGALITYDLDARAGLGAAGHLYFVIGQGGWDHGQYWTDDPTLLEDRQAEQAQREEERQREAAEREELSTLIQQVENRWVDSIPERTGGDGSDVVARHVLRTAQAQSCVPGWLDIGYDGPRPAYYGGTPPAEWGEWVDQLSRAQRWRAARLLASRPDFEDPIALVQIAGDIAPELVARLSELLHVDQEDEDQ